MKIPALSSVRLTLRRWATPSILVAACVVALAGAASAAQPKGGAAKAGGREMLIAAGGVAHVYKQVGAMELHLYVFTPPDRKPGERHPAILFFHGGGFVGGDPSSYVDQCKHFAARGLVAITAAYRLKGQESANVLDSCMDGKSAVRWVRAHADELGIDPGRLVVSGGSAGGFISVFTTFIEKFNDPNDDPKTSCIPNALVLFNPGVEATEEKARQKGGEEAVGLVKEISPLGHVRKDAPPTIIFHGTADTTVPIESVLRFQKKMQELGNRCEIVSYDGRKHSFFNREPDKTDVIQKSDAFLTGLGYLKGKPGAQKQ